MTDPFDYTLIRDRLLSDQTGFVNRVTDGVDVNFTTLTQAVASNASAIQSIINNPPAGLSPEQASVMGRLLPAMNAESVPPLTDLTVEIVGGTYETDIPDPDDVASVEAEAEPYTLSELLASANPTAVDVGYGSEMESCALTVNAQAGTISVTWNGNNAFGLIGHTLSATSTIDVDRTWRVTFTLRDGANNVVSTVTFATDYLRPENGGPWAGWYAEGEQGSWFPGRPPSEALQVGVQYEQSVRVVAYPAVLINGNWYADDFRSCCYSNFLFYWCKPPHRWRAFTSNGGPVVIWTGDVGFHGGVLADSGEWVNGLQSFDVYSSTTNYYWSYQQFHDFRAWRQVGDAAYSASYNVGSIYFGDVEAQNGALLEVRYSGGGSLVLRMSGYTDQFNAKWIESGDTLYQYSNFSLSSPNGYNSELGALPGEGLPYNAGTFGDLFADDLRVGGAGWCIDFANRAVVGAVGWSLGFSNTVSGDYSLALGSNNTVSGDYSLALGYSNTVSGGYSLALGYSNTVNSFYSLALGYSNTVNSFYSLALGSNNTVSGEHSLALGSNNTVNSFYSLARGYSNTVSGGHSLALGYSNTVSGGHSLALGYSNTVSGGHSLAVGNTLYCRNGVSMLLGWVSGSRTYATATLVGFGETNGAATNPVLFASGAANLHLSLRESEDVEVVFYYEAHVVGRTRTGNKAVAFVLRGCLRRPAGGGSLVAVGTEQKESWKDSGMTAADVTRGQTASSVNGGRLPTFLVTGVSGYVMDWTARVTLTLTS